MALLNGITFKGTHEYRWAIAWAVYAIMGGYCMVCGRRHEGECGVRA